MRVSSNSCSPEFVPFDLTFKVETEQDAQRLYFMFNYTPIVDGTEVDSVAAIVCDEIMKHAKRYDARFDELKRKFATVFRRCNP